MALIKFPFIGFIDISSLDNLYTGEGELNGKRFSIDLNFEINVTSVETAAYIRHFIDNIRIHDINNKKKIEFDFFEEDTVAGYIDHQLDELSTADIEEIIGRNVKPDLQPESLMKKMQLVRVGIYPENKEQFAIFDYSFGNELTSQVIAIDTDENGNFIQLNWES